MAVAVHIDENSCFYLGFQVTSLNYFPCCRGEMKLKAPPPMREGGRWIHFASTPCEYLLKLKFSSHESERTYFFALGKMSANKQR